MRLWSLHPKYLDPKGLVALWREALLAKKVLEGKTKGYKHHPQLLRFKHSGNAIDCINQYLVPIYNDSSDRGYSFNKSKINFNHETLSLTVTEHQVKFETVHLLEKLKKRDPERYQKLSQETLIDVHPMFRVVDGPIEDWEIIADTQPARES